MQKDLLKYRNLATLTDAEWENLNIHIFIAANFNRYCSTLIKKIGIQYLPSDATETLLSLFCDVGHKPLKKLHKLNLQTKGERRNQVMLGTLKMIATTRMVDAVIREFPSYVTLDSITENFDSDDQFDDEFIPAAQCADSSLTAFYAADSCDAPTPEDEQVEADIQEERVSLMIETLRSYLTPMQYKHIRYAICDGLSSAEIAERTGHSVTNVRIMLLNARKKMIELVPPSMSPDFQQYLHRR